MGKVNRELSKTGGSTAPSSQGSSSPNRPQIHSRLAKAVESAASAHALVMFGSYEERADREVMFIETMYGRGVDVPTAGDGIPVARGKFWSDFVDLH